MVPASTDNGTWRYTTNSIVLVTNVQDLSTIIPDIRDAVDSEVERAGIRLSCRPPVLVDVGSLPRCMRRVANDQDGSDRLIGWTCRIVENFQCSSASYSTLRIAQESVTLTGATT